MKVLLISPPYSVAEHVTTPWAIHLSLGSLPPLGPAYIAAVLGQSGHAVTILDAPVLGLGVEDIVRHVVTTGPDVVGLHTLTPDWPTVLDLARRIKAARPQTILVLGGAHLSLFPRESLEFDFVDYAIRGEAEFAFRDLLEAVANGRSARHVPGLVYRQDGRIVVNDPPAIIEDLDRLPWPARNLLPMDRYRVIIMEPPVATIVSARGCPFHCGYCYKDAQLDRYRTRNPIDVVDEIAALKADYHVRTLSFYDDCFPDRGHLAAICRELIRRKLSLRWETPQRVDLVDPDLIALMKAAGCYRIRYGVESGSPRILARMKKDISIPQIENAFSWTRRAGIETFAYFMVGYPTETQQDYEQTLALARRLRMDWACFSMPDPIPATDLWRMAVTEHGMDPDYWTCWARGLTREPLPPLHPDAAALCARAYRSFYLRPSVAWQRLTSLRHPAQLRMYWRGFKALLQIR